VTTLFENLDVWVVSYGGTISNTFSRDLESMGFRVRTPAWRDKLCHGGPHLAAKSPVPVLYLFRDPRAAALSQLRRGTHWQTNQRKMTARTDYYRPEAPRSTLMMTMEHFDLSWQNAPPQADVLGIHAVKLYQKQLSHAHHELLRDVLGPKFRHVALSDYAPTPPKVPTEEERRWFRPHEGWRREVMARPAVYRIASAPR